MKKFCWIIKLAKKEKKKTAPDNAHWRRLVARRRPLCTRESSAVKCFIHSSWALSRRRGGYFSGEVDGDEVKDGSLSIKAFFLPATKSGQNRTRKRFATQNMEFCFPTQRRRVVTREEIVRVYGNDGVTLLVIHIWQNISSRQRAKNKPFCVSLRRKQINLTPVCQQCLSRLGVMKSK